MFFTGLVLIGCFLVCRWVVNLIFGPDEPQPAPVPVPKALAASPARAPRRSASLAATWPTAGLPTPEPKVPTADAAVRMHKLLRNRLDAVGAPAAESMAFDKILPLLQQDLAE